MPREAAPLSLNVLSDLSAKQFYIATLSATQGAAELAIATSIAIGVILNKPKVDIAARIHTAPGERVPAAMDGTTDIAILDWLGPNAAGVLVKKATADYSVCAVALEACTTNGVEIHDVLWIGPGFFRSVAG